MVSFAFPQCVSFCTINNFVGYSIKSWIELKDNFNANLPPAGIINGTTKIIKKFPNKFVTTPAVIRKSTISSCT